MKRVIKLIFIALICVSNASTAMAQKKKEPVIASTPFLKAEEAINDSTPLFSVKDYKLFYDNYVSKLPTSEGVQIIDFWQSLLNDKIKKWTDKHSKKK